MQRAWKRVKANKGAAGVDCMDIAETKSADKQEFSYSLLRFFLPGRIRIETADCIRCRRSLRPQILAVHDTVVVDDKCLDSRFAVFRGITNQGETTDQLAFHHVIQRSARCRFALRSQNTKEITVIRLALQMADAMD